MCNFTIDQKIVMKATTRHHSIFIRRDNFENEGSTFTVLTPDQGMEELIPHTTVGMSDVAVLP
jgi:hypothetical protein